MESRRNGEHRRSIFSALAVVVAVAVPTLVPSAALAENNPDKPSADAPDTKSKAAAKPRAKKAPKAAKVAGAKKDGHDKSDARAKAAEPKKDAGAAASKGKKTKKTASRAPSTPKKKTAKKADGDAPGRRCPGTPIHLDRGGLEGQSLALVDCHDRPVDTAGEALSVLARPWGAPRPGKLPAQKGKADPAHRKNGEIAPGVRLLDKGLSTRLAAIAKRFPNRPISLVSGYRPASRGSLHQHGKALDLRVAGVSNEELVTFCRTLPDTGCGYYPNSSFVHVDVRSPGAGKVTWIDSSGPGEAPNYVKQWPLPPEESDGAVLPPDREPHDANVDPWALDAGDEHTPHDGTGLGTLPKP